MRLQRQYAQPHIKRHQPNAKNNKRRTLVRTGFDEPEAFAIDDGGNIECWEGEEGEWDKDVEV